MPLDVSVLCVNVGSSSLKLALFDVGPTGSRQQRWRWSESTQPDRPRDLSPAVEELRRLGHRSPSVVGHRIVHGGPRYRGPQRIDAAVLSDLDALTPFAPLHQPACLDGVRAAQQVFPEAVHVASFDTAFHHTLPDVASHLGLAKSSWDDGIRRYGFHGLSYRHVVDQVGAAWLGRSVIAHLGSGSSLCAVADGRSIDTTMGLTPAGGVVMATRAGDLDPGVLLYLLRHGGPDATALGPDELERVVNQQSGLLGLSGGTSDMRALLTARATDPQADLACRVFCRDITKHIGSLAAALGGLDTLVFTGGIGEHSSAVRAEICAPLGFLGVTLDHDANEGHATTISSPAATAEVLVVATDEERVIAGEAWQEASWDA